MQIKIGTLLNNNKAKNIEILTDKYNLEVNENALFKAIFLEDMALLEVLHNCGIEFNEKINNTYPLHFAAFRGNLEVFQFIYSKLKHIDTKALSTAILNNKNEIVTFILKELNGERIKLDLNEYVDDNFTPLSLSIMVDNKEITKELISLKVNVNKIEKKRGDSPLMLAVNSSNIDIVELLLEAGANPNFIAKDGFTPLIVASYIGNLEIVKKLLNHNIDVFYTTVEGVDALKMAISNNKIEVTKHLQQTLSK